MGSEAPALAGAARAYNNEIIFNVVNDAYFDFALSLVMQLRVLGMEHYVMLAPYAAVCAQLQAAAAKAKDLVRARGSHTGECTTPPLIPTVNGNTVRSFSTHAQLSAAKGSLTTVLTTLIRLIQHLDSSALGLVRKVRKVAL